MYLLTLPLPNCLIKGSCIGWNIYNLTNHYRLFPSTVHCTRLLCIRPCVYQSCHACDELTFVIVDIDAGSACECELNYVKADVSSDSMLCT